MKRLLKTLGASAIIAGATLSFAAPAVASPVTPDSSVSVQAASKMWRSATVSSIHSTSAKALNWAHAEAKKIDSWSGYRSVSVNSKKVWNGSKYVWKGTVQYVYYA